MQPTGNNGFISVCSKKSIIAQYLNQLKVLLYDQIFTVFKNLLTRQSHSQQEAEKPLLPFDRLVQHFS